MTETHPTDQLPVTGEEQAKLAAPDDSRRGVYTFLAISVILMLIIATVVAVIAMLNNPTETETIRDIVIIFLALEFSIIGLVLIVLIIQLSLLTELLRNEIAPMIESTNEALANVRGTTEFLSDNLAQPVIRASASMNALREAIRLLRFR